MLRIDLSRARSASLFCAPADSSKLVPLQDDRWNLFRVILLTRLLGVLLLRSLSGSALACAASPACFSCELPQSSSDHVAERTGEEQTWPDERPGGRGGAAGDRTARVLYMFGLCSLVVCLCVWRCLLVCCICFVHDMLLLLYVHYVLLVLILASQRSLGS